jgi:hypothetical protein
VRAWGGARLIHVNVWAGIATKPEDLWAMPDPVGPENDPFIAAAAREVSSSGGFLVFAWGAIRPPRALREEATRRLAAVAALVRGEGCRIFALGENRDGSPKHPLYVRDVRPSLWSER